MAIAVASIFTTATSKLLAGTLGPLTYTDTGSSITINSCDNFFQGDLIIPETIDGKPVTSIGPSAFIVIYGIKNVTIPASVTEIGEYAFLRCLNLCSVSIPAKVTSIRRGTFSECVKLIEINIPESTTEIADFAFSGSGLRSIRIPSSVKVMGSSVFESCVKLTKIELPDSIEQMVLGSRIFASCSELAKIELPDTMRKISNGMFASCPKLRDIRLPANLTYIGEFAFAGSGFAKIDLGSRIKKIGDSAFQFCSALKEISFPQSLIEIGNNAFAYSGVRKIELGSRIKKIGVQAFQNCDNLFMISFPQSLIEIGDEAFIECGNLLSAYFSGNTPKIGKQVFQYTASDFRIYFSDKAKGYTIPKWEGYPSSFPREQIAVFENDGNYIAEKAATLSFGGIILEKRGIVKRLTIRNVGALKLKGLSTVISGEDSFDYVLKNITKSSLAPGQSAIIEIQFTPKERGGRFSVIEISSSDTDRKPFEVKLAGKGLKLID